MKELSTIKHQTFDSFDSRILHTDFSQIDLIQLSPGRFHGWMFSAQMAHCRIAVGSFNQAIICEGNYNPDTLHIGFILSPGHSAVVQAHEYDDGTLTIHRNAIGMHEVFPPDLTWVNISIPEKKLPQTIPPFTIEKLAGLSQIFMKGSRSSLTALIQWIDNALDFPDQCPKEDDLLTTVNELLFNRVVYQDSDPDFTTGDTFRMHLIEATHQLIQKKDNPPSLAEICKAIGMKPRTLQKYFQEIYGMGPTEYIRIRRLNEARSDLLTGSNNVGDVAYRWQFYHLGRFAGRYKTHFAESPKETLGSGDSVKP